MPPKKSTRKSLVTEEESTRSESPVPSEEVAPIIVQDVPSSVAEVAMTCPESESVLDCDQAVDSYLNNCHKFGIQVDPGVVIALKTG
jgi:hypothetical protein